MILLSTHQFIDCHFDSSIHFHCSQFLIIVFCFLFFSYIPRVLYDTSNDAFTVDFVCQFVFHLFMFIFIYIYIHIHSLVEYILLVLSPFTYFIFSIVKFSSRRFSSSYICLECFIVICVFIPSTIIDDFNDFCHIFLQIQGRHCSLHVNFYVNFYVYEFV